MTPKERFYQVMRFQCPGQTLATLGGIWPSTKERWVREGMPPELLDHNRMLEHFGLEPHLWTGPQAQVYVYPPFERRVVRETAETVTYVNENGITCTDFRTNAYQSMPHFEEFPLKTRADWPAFRERLRPAPGRVGEAWAKQVRELRQDRLPVIMALTRGASLYGSLREMLGVERLSLMIFDDPAWVEEMMDAMVELFLSLCDELFTDYVPDAVCLWEDMAYKTASLLGVRQVREFMLPRYRVMTQKLREKGVPFILLDSDGCIRDLIPLWLEAGIDGVVPMEANAEMDVAAYRAQYPTLLMMGGVDKRALAFGRDAIDHEIDKIRRTIASGGLIPFFDHGLPHDASYANFVYFTEQLKRVARGQ